MTVTSITASMFSTPSGPSSKSPLDVAAKLFGMSKSDLTAELKSGKSLNDVAKEKEISPDDLDKTLVANMPSSMAASASADQIAQRIASRVGLPGGHHRHSQAPAPASDTSTPAASDPAPSTLLDTTA